MTTKIEAGARLTQVTAAPDPQARKLLNNAITFLTNGGGGALAKAPDGALMAATVADIELSEVTLIQLARVVKATHGYRIKCVPVSQGKLMLVVYGEAVAIDKRAILKDALSGTDFKIKVDKPTRLEVKFDASDDEVWVVLDHALATANQNHWKLLSNRGAICTWRINDATELQIDGNRREATVYTI